MDYFWNQPYINLGPYVDDLLTLLNGKHRADSVWANNVKHDVLFARRGSLGAHYENIDDRIIPYLRLTGFYGVSQIGVMHVDANLMTALVERWRPETHTFHLSVGEATITLQDIEILTGLPIDGRAITCHLNYNWPIMCQQLLGQMPPEDAFSGNSIKMTWLSETFNQLPDNATEYDIQCFTRAWILRCIGGLLCPSASNNLIHLMWLPLLEHLEEVGNYSWGSAVLAWLYRELCRATRPTAQGLGGYHQLLQMWAWERLTLFRPRFIHGVLLDQSKPYGYRWRSPIDMRRNNNRNINDYRVDLDRQRDDQMEWEPYSSVMHLLPNFCTNGHHIWRSIVPLICFNLIEWHHPDRCLRQFGMDQPIPDKPLIEDHLHSVDLRGHLERDWENKFATFIFEWENRQNRVVSTPLITSPLHLRSQYMQWYILRTRRWISRTGAAYGAASDGVERIFHNDMAASSSSQGGDIHSISESILGALGAIDRTSTDYPRQPVPRPVQIPPMSRPYVEFRQTRRSRRGMAERRTTVPPIHIPPGVQQVPQPMLWPYGFGDSSGSFGMPAFVQPTFYDPQSGPPTCYDYEAGPSRLNVDLNVSISEPEQAGYNSVIPPIDMQEGMNDPIPQDDFLDELIHDTNVMSDQVFMDQPLYSGGFNDSIPEQTDPENFSSSSYSRFR